LVAIEDKFWLPTAAVAEGVTAPAPNEEEEMKLEPVVDTVTPPLVVDAETKVGNPTPEPPLDVNVWEALKTKVAFPLIMVVTSTVYEVMLELPEIVPAVLCGTTSVRGITLEHLHSVE
jgi:hypothetical protein